MLSDEEFALIEPLIIQEIRNYPAKHETLAEIKTGEMISTPSQPALDAYEKLTGYRLDNSKHLWFVRLSDYGRPCPACTKPFRTPQAKYCAECGIALPDGEKAGSASG